MRLFIAIEISDQVRRQVAKRIDLLRTKFSELRVSWEKPEKLHLTLKFLGEIAEDRLSDLITATERVAQQISPFELVIEDAGVFPVRGTTNVLWLDVTRGKEKLQQINQTLEDAYYALGFEKEKRLFTPHLTIARLREPRRAQKLVKCHLAEPFPAIACAALEVVVFQSQQKANGVFYHPLARFAFKK